MSTGLSWKFFPIDMFWFGSNKEKNKQTRLLQETEPAGHFPF